MGKRDPIRTIFLMTATLIGYARCSTDRQDLATQQQAILEFGVAGDRIYTGDGLTGTTCARPGLDLALAAVLEGDTLAVPKLDRLARSVPDARQGKIARQAAQPEGQKAAGTLPHAPYGRVLHQRER